MYDFSQPVTENIRIKAVWDCACPFLSLKQTAGSGTVRIYNIWKNGYIIVNGQYIYEGSYKEFTFSSGGNLELNFYYTGTTKLQTNASATNSGKVLALPVYSADVELELDIMDLDRFDLASDYLFSRFNMRGCITSLSDRTFTDFDKVTTPGMFFFNEFNDNPKLTSLPAGSFDTSNITALKSCSFRWFMRPGVDTGEHLGITTLPEGSFHFDSLTSAEGYSILESFFPTNFESLPAGSFQFPALTDLSEAGNFLALTFYNNTALATLPEGAFNMPVLEQASGLFTSTFEGATALQSLPSNCFKLPALQTVLSLGSNMFTGVTNITQLPSGFMNCPQLTTITGGAFGRFNYEGSLQSLGSGSFQFPSLTSVGDYYCSEFNNGGALTALPVGGLGVDTITNAGWYFFNRFNYEGGALTRGNESFTFVAPISINNLNVGDQSNVGQGTTVYINGE